MVITKTYITRYNDGGNWNGFVIRSDALPLVHQVSAKANNQRRNAIIRTTCLMMKNNVFVHLIKSIYPLIWDSS